MLSILLLTANTWASDLLVPAFSPKPGSESAGAEMMYSAAIDAIRDRRIEFLDDNDIRTFAGSAGDDCALRKECPGNLWGTLEGRLAMIGTVGMNGDMLSVVVEFHRPGVDGPVEFLQDDLPTKDVYNLAVDLALIADDLLHLKDEDLGGGAAGVAAAGALGGAAATAAILGSLEDPAEGGDGLAVASDPVLGDAPAEGSEEEPEGAVAAAPLAPEPEPATAAEPEPEPEPEPETAVAPAHRERTQRAASGEEKAEQRRMGLPLYAYNKYRASGKDPAQWMADEQVRTRRFFIELHAGVSFGDVKRRYATRVAVQQQNEGEFYPLAYYERDGLLPGAAFSTAFSFGYTPVWWFEGGLLLGIEFPRKELITGWEAYAPPNEYSSRSPDSQDQVVYQPATAIALLLEPRVRFLFIPVGMVKPYALVGWSTRFYDRYETPDLDHVKFPDRSGVVSSGPTGGLGVSYDPQHRASGFVESTFTKLLGPKTIDNGRGGMSSIPQPEGGTGVVVSLRAGVTTRF